MVTRRQVMLAIVTSVVVCAVLTVSGVLPSSPDEWGYEARTDTKLRSLEEARWFQIPYPGGSELSTGTQKWGI